MLVNCPICSEILLPTDVLCSTPCGHIFHLTPCLNRWLSSNSTCPQCRQDCPQSSVHRIYLPEVTFQDNDQLVERMNEINRQKIECENKMKKLEKDKKSLESDVRKRKRDFHKLIQRGRSQRKKGGNSSIPANRFKSHTVSLMVGASTSSAEPRVAKDQASVSSTGDQSKRKRNNSRVQRAKSYFRRKRDEHRNNNNDSSDGQQPEARQRVGTLPLFSDDSSN